MDTIVYFIRHAEPDFQVKEDALRPLTAEGEVKAKQLVNRFKEITVDQVVSSPYKRAYDTVKPMADSKGLEIEILDDFRERKVSDKPWIEDFTSFAQNQWQDFNFKLEGGESLQEVQHRNIKTLEKVLAAYKGKCIVVGTHGTALSTIIYFYEKSFGYESFNSIKKIMPWVVKFTFSIKDKPTISYDLS